MVGAVHVMIAVIGLVVLTLIGCWGISFVVAWKLSHPKRKPIDETPADYGLVFEPIDFFSRDGSTRLKGWFLPAEGEAKMTLIFAHGYRGNRLVRSLPGLHLASSLVKSGYHVVMFDFRRSGESEGSLTTVGLHEKLDILGAIDWVKNDFPGRIGLVGFSMGAAAALLAAADSFDVRGVVADSSFSHLTRYLSDNMHIWSKLPKFPFTPLILLTIRLIANENIDEVEPLSAVDKVYPRPILFIHGDSDPVISWENSELMREKHPDAFSLWKPCSDTHVGAFRDHPEEYSDRLIRFFDEIVSAEQSARRRETRISSAEIPVMV